MAMFVGQLFAADGKAIAIDKDEAKAAPMIHFASVEEIAALPDAAHGGPSDAEKAMHTARVAENLVRILITDDGGFRFAGRIIYGVQPLPGEFPKSDEFQALAKICDPAAFAVEQKRLEDKALSATRDSSRVSTILNFFRGVAELCGVPDLSYITGVRASGMNVTWVSPVHAATVIEAKPINLFSFYEAAARLVHEFDLKVAKDEIIPSVNKPFFLLVYNKEMPVDVLSRSQAISLPIYPGKEGWRWAIFTRIDGEAVPSFPAKLTEAIGAYKLWSDSIG